MLQPAQRIFDIARDLNDRGHGFRKEATSAACGSVRSRGAIGAYHDARLTHRGSILRRISSRQESMSTKGSRVNHAYRRLALADGFHRSLPRAGYGSPLIPVGTQKHRRDFSPWNIDHRSGAKQRRLGDAMREAATMPGGVARKISGYCDASHADHWADWR